MGSFLGHLYPGIAFFMFGLIGSITTLHEWLLKKENYKCRKIQPTRKCGRLPVEALMWLILPVFGIIGEIATAGHIRQHFQHISMYAFFMLSGSVDLLVHFRFRVPPKLDHIMLALAFGVELILFKYHLYHRDEFNTHLHVLLLWVLSGCVSGCLLEVAYPASVLSALTRHCCVLLQGTWFIQVGYILYPPFPSAIKWDPESNEDLMFTTAIFTWHIAGNILFLTLMTLVIRWCIGDCNTGSPKTPIANGQTNARDCHGDKDASVHIPLFDPKSDAEEDASHNLVASHHDC